jgi:1,4-alpha-glucan branching enzyme
MVESKLNDAGEILVTFRLPHAATSGEVSVVGEFNDWSPTANPMHRDGEGFVAHITLKPGRVYRFRYLIDGQRWENDWAADAYVPNEFGGDDSVIDLTDRARGGRLPASGG